MLKSKNKKTHGGSKDRLYLIWGAMRKRCNNKADKDYYLYGGRGISVCDEWNDYVGFSEWAYANGYDKDAKTGKCTLDRVDVNGNYCPENCRWVDMKVQCNNKTNTKRYEVDGELKTIREWCNEYLADYILVRNRVGHGWDIKDALTLPPNQNRGYVNA